MAFELYALLDNKEELALDNMMVLIKSCLHNEKCSFSLEKIPFEDGQHIHIAWKDWVVKVFLETGNDVLEDNKTIEKLTSNKNC